MLALHQWIEDEAGEAIADAYLDRLEAKCWSLCDFPGRGTPRVGIGDGIRSITFERRLIIFYRVERQVLLILRIVSGARDLTALPTH